MLVLHYTPQATDTESSAKFSNIDKGESAEVHAENNYTLTFESSVKLKYWKIIATIKKTIPTTIPNDSGLKWKNLKEMKQILIIFLKLKSHQMDQKVTL